MPNPKCPMTKANPPTIRERSYAGYCLLRVLQRVARCNTESQAAHKVMPVVVLFFQVILLAT